MTNKTQGKTERAPEDRAQQSRAMIERHLVGLDTDKLKLGYLVHFFLDHKSLTSKETKKAINSYMSKIDENLGNLHEAAQNAEDARELLRAKGLWRRIALEEEQKGNYIHISGAAHSWLKAGEPKKAAIIFEKAYNYREATEAWEEAGELERAAEDLERVGLVYSDCFERARVLWEKLGKPGNSILAIKKRKGKKAVAEMLDKRKIFDVAGRFWEESGELEKAANSYFEYSKQDINCPDTIGGHSIKWNVAFNLSKAGRIWADLGKKDLSVRAYTQAAEMYEQASKYFSHSGDMWEAAECWREAGQNEKAHEITRQLIRPHEFSESELALGSAINARGESESLARDFSEQLKEGNVNKSTLQSYLSEIESSRKVHSVPGVQLAIKICNMLGDKEKARKYLTMLKDSYYLQDNGMMYKIYSRKLARFERSNK